MPANTTNQQITYPIGTDLADNPLAFTDMLADVENRLVQRYTSVADRTARNPAPNTGEISFISGTTWYERYTGSKWIACTDIQVFKTAAETVNNSTALQNDNELLLPIPAVVANWTIEAVLFYSSSTTADIKVTFAANAGIASLSFGFQGLAVGTAAATVTGDTNWDSQSAGTAIPTAGINVGSTITGSIIGGFISTGVAGTLQLQWAQNALDATNTQVSPRSWLRMTAVS